MIKLTLNIELCVKVFLNFSLDFFVTTDTLYTGVGDFFVFNFYIDFFHNSPSPVYPGLLIKL